jgi:hypothetical protein
MDKNFERYKELRRHFVSQNEYKLDIWILFFFELAGIEKIMRGKT